MVIDGKPGKRYKECQPIDLYDNTLFFAHGARYLYVGAQEKTRQVVVDGIEQEEFNFVGFTTGQSYLRADDEDYAYVAGIGKTKFVMNGKASYAPQISWGGGVQQMFVLFGTHAAWIESALLNSTLQHAVYVDGKQIPLPKGAFVVASTLTLTRSGAFAFSIREDKATRFCIDGVLTPAYTEAGFRVRYSADGKHHAYVIRVDGKWKAIIDGREHEIPGKPHLDVHLSDDGSHWAMQVQVREKENAILHDGKVVGKSYPDLIGPILSGDGKHVMAMALTLVNGTLIKQVVLDGIEHAKYHQIDNPTFSADGRLAYIAQRSEKGKYVVVVDGKEQKEYGYIPFSIGVIQHGTLNWGADGRTLSYIARDHVGSDPKAPSQRGRLVIDGQERRPYEVIAPQGNTKLTVGPDSISYVALKDGAFYWVEERRVPVDK